MLNPLKSLGDLKKLREQAMEMQRQLEAEEIKLEKEGVYVKMTGNQTVKEIKVDGQSDDRLARVLNETLKKSQEIAAKKLASMGGGLRGLLGK